MKVAIAKGFFAPSERMAKRLIELGMTVTDHDEDKMTKEHEGELIHYPKELWKGDPRWGTSDKYYFKDDHNARTDPRVIQAIEEIGEKESIQRIDVDDYDRDYRMQIIEIPDGVDFYVTEPECSIGEIIVEKHRTWGSWSEDQ